MISKDKRKSI